MIIIVDTREQIPLEFRKSSNVEGTKIATLKTGDYSIEGYEDKISFDRKNPADLFGSLGSGRKRFGKELERAQEMDYFAIIVECSYTNIKEKTFEGAEFIRKMRGDVVIKQIHTLKQKYGIDTIFCNGRKEMASYIRDVFVSYLNQQKIDVKNNTDT